MSIQGILLIVLIFVCILVLPVVFVLRSPDENEADKPENVDRRLRETAEYAAVRGSARVREMTALVQSIPYVTRATLRAERRPRDIRNRLHERGHLTHPRAPAHRGVFRCLPQAAVDILRLVRLVFIRRAQDKHDRKHQNTHKNQDNQQNPLYAHLIRPPSPPARGAVSRHSRSAGGIPPAWDARHRAEHRRFSPPARAAV